jgi:hypothetical protein
LFFLLIDPAVLRQTRKRRPQIGGIIPGDGAPTRRISVTFRSRQSEAAVRE